MQIESILSCPACGSDGKIFLEGCRDYNCGLPGTWSFKKCQQCSSIWMDPRPTKEMIPSLYPDYTFTHNQPEPPLQEPQGFLSRLRFAAKLGILERSFGYTGLSQRTSLSWGAKLGKLLSYIPGISQWAGYTIRFLHYRPQGRLLEVGVGNGTFLWLMKELGWQVTGIEPDPQAAKAAASTGLEIIPCGVEDANLEPSSYDAIVLHHVLEHLPDPKIALSQLAASLKPSGTLVSISPNPVSTIASLFGHNWYGLADVPRHLVLPSPKGYKCMLKDTASQVNISTTMQIAFWMLRESLSMRQTGQVGKYQGWLLPKFFSSLGSILLPLFPNSGEEVICLAVKK